MHVNNVVLWPVQDMQIRYGIVFTLLERYQPHLCDPSQVKVDVHHDPFFLWLRWLRLGFGQPAM